ncbi:MAG TPA: lipopolysaccharide biosynthesis protein [Kofleriaceae bacterium]|nr:lipopolysaccharide biosynthesis protein [Kofleriaceae bacterium]
MSEPSLRTKTTRGIASSLLGVVGTNIVRIASIAILARLLTPADFGIVAVAMTVVMLVQNVRDIGVGGAIVQRKDLTIDELRSAFAFSVWLGFALTAVMALTAPWIADLFGEPKAVPYIRALSAMFAIRGLSMVPYVLLQREFGFRHIAIIDTGTYAIGSLASVVLAAMGFGAWSIVWGDLIEIGLGVIAIWWVRRPPFALRIHWQHLRGLLGIGAGYTVVQLANVAATQSDNAIVSRQLGGDALGFYSRAYDMVRIPSMMFTSIVGSVMFPAFATLQNDAERLGQAFRRSLFATAVILTPASIGLIVLAPEVIATVIGPQWTNTVLPFQIMGATMLFRTSYKIGAIVARASGDAARTAVTQAVYAVAVIAGAIFASRWGIAGVATSTAIAVTLNFLMLTGLGMHYTNLKWWDVVNAHRQAVLAGLLTLAGAWPTAWLLRQAGAPRVVTLVVTTLVGALGPLALAYRGVRNKGSDWHWVWEALRTGLRGKRKKKKVPAQHLTSTEDVTKAEPPPA